MQIVKLCSILSDVVHTDLKLVPVEPKEISLGELEAKCD